jgi:hypothetical protein
MQERTGDGDMSDEEEREYLVEVSVSLSVTVNVLAENAEQAKEQVEDDPWSYIGDLRESTLSELADAEVGDVKPWR